MSCPVMFPLYTVRPGGGIVPRVGKALFNITCCDRLECLAYIPGYAAGASDGKRHSYILSSSPQ